MNLKDIGYGIVSFFIGVFLMMILLPLMNQLTTALNAGTYAIGDTIEGIIWTGVILTWLLTTIVIPAYFIHVGSKSPENDTTPGFVKIAVGTLIFFFSIMITYQAWFMITGISTAMDTTTQQAFYWIGFVINWTMITIVTPVMLILDGNKTT